MIVLLLGMAQEKAVKHRINTTFKKRIWLGRIIEKLQYYNKYHMDHELNHTWNDMVGEQTLVTS